MHTKALTNLTDKELRLLKHLAAFRAPFYFDNVRVSFISNERNRSALFALFFTLHAKRYIRLATIPEALPVVNKKNSDITYEVSDLGRIMAVYSTNIKI